MLAICSLCSHKRSQVKIITDNVTSHLLRLARSEDLVISSCAVRAICVLCANKATRLRLVKEGVVPLIVSQSRAGAWHRRRRPPPLTNPFSPPPPTSSPVSLPVISAFLLRLPPPALPWPRALSPSPRSVVAELFFR